MYYKCILQNENTDVFSLHFDWIDFVERGKDEALDKKKLEYCCLLYCTMLVCSFFFEVYLVGGIHFQSFDHVFERHDDGGIRDLYLSREI